MADQASRATDERSVVTIVTRRQYGVYCCGLILSILMLVLIIAVIIVLLLVEGENAAIVLPVLLVLLIITAISSFIFIRWQHRKAAQRRRQQATEWMFRSLSQNQLPTAPSESTRTSWAFWRKSSLASGPFRPSAPPASNSSHSGSNKTAGYNPVATNVNAT